MRPEAGGTRVERLGEEPMDQYDLFVIGSGPAGQKAAIQAAKLGKRVGDRRAPAAGRRRLHQHRHDPQQDAARGGALPPGYRQRDVLRQRLPRKENIDVEDLTFRAQHGDQARDRGRARPAAAQRRRPRAGQRRVRRPAHVAVEPRRTACEV